MSNTDTHMVDSLSSLKQDEAKSTLSRGKSDSSLESFRIAVMGAKGVGKTCLIYNLLRMDRQRMSSSDYKADTSSEENAVFSFKHGTNTIELEESTHFENLLAESVKTDGIFFRARAFILVFDLSVAKTFDNVSELKDVVQSIKGNDVPMIIVGNKLDKPNVAITAVTDCIISIDWELTYVETSAELGLNITKLMPSIFRHKSLIYLRLPFVENIIRRHSDKHPGKRSPVVRQTSDRMQHILNRRNSFNQELDFGSRILQRNITFWRKKRKSKKTVPNDTTKVNTNATASFGIKSGKKNDRNLACTKICTCLKVHQKTIPYRNIRQTNRYTLKPETISVGLESKKQADYQAGIRKKPLNKGEDFGTSTRKGVVMRTEMRREKNVNRDSLFDIIRRYFRRH